MKASRRDLTQLLLMALCLGLIVAWASLSLRAGTRHDALYNLGAVLQREAFRSGEELRADLPFYNRVFFPLLHRALYRLLPFATESQWYMLLRIFSFQAAFAVFALVCRLRLGTSSSVTALATALLAMATIASFNFPWEDPADAIDLLVLSAGVGAAISRRFLWSLALAVVFASNRESAAFLGLIWIFVLATPQNWLRRTIEGGAICALSYGTTLLLKLTLGPVFIGNYVTPAINLDRLMAGFWALNPLGWLAMLVTVTALFATFLDLRVWLVGRFLALAVLVAGIAILFGLVNELRVFLPSFVLLAFAVAVSPQRSA